MCIPITKISLYIWYVQQKRLHKTKRQRSTQITCSVRVWQSSLVRLKIMVRL
jgi:thymidylate synthase